MLMLLRSLCALSCVALTACAFPLSVGAFGGREGLALAGDPCDDDAGCADGLVCSDGRCDAAPVDEPAACTTDADCEGGLCGRDGLCAPTTNEPYFFISEMSQYVGRAEVGFAVVGEAIIVENLGEAPLVLSSLSIGGVDAGSFQVGIEYVDNGDGTVSIDDLSSSLGEFTLAPGEQQSFYVVFSAQQEGNSNAELVINSNDTDSSQITVELTGLGTPAGVIICRTDEDCAAGERCANTTTFLCEPL